MRAFEYDATTVKPSGGFMPVPPAIYLMVIKNVTEKTTKNNDVMYSVECEVDDKDYLGSKVWHNVTFLPPDRKGAGMAIYFLKCIGEPWEGKIIIEPDNWLGKHFIAKVGIEQDLKGRDRNMIISIDSIPGERDDILTASPSVASDEEVPF